MWKYEESGRVRFTIAEYEVKKAHQLLVRFLNERLKHDGNLPYKKKLLMKQVFLIPRRQNKGITYLDVHIKTPDIETVLGQVYWTVEE